MTVSNLLPIIVAFIIVAAILIICVYVLRRYARYLRIAETLPDPVAIQSTEAQVIDEKRDRLAAQLVDDWPNLPPGERDVTRNALWKAMILVTASDGSIDLRETRFVADLFGRIIRAETETELTVEAAERVQRQPKAALADISRASGVSKTSKEFILAGAFLVSVSDHALAEVEADCLGDIAGALAINERERKAIFNGMTERFGL